MINFWDVRNGAPSDMTAALTAVKRGYAYVVQNERGHLFSEGNYDILGAGGREGWLTLVSRSQYRLNHRSGGLFQQRQLKRR